MGSAKYYRLSIHKHLVKEEKLKYLYSWPQLQMEMGLHGLVLNGVQGTSLYTESLLSPDWSHSRCNTVAAKQLMMPTLQCPVCQQQILSIPMMQEMSKQHFWVVVLVREVGRRQKHTRLGLSNNIMPLYTWNNSTLLNCRRLFKTIRIDAS